ncbi:ATP-dependent DNA helicase UvrD2 [Gleimia sp. 6138-11-ORH1]|uniref:ATP-dependent DNA helicase UvrD2 n=1 Tax=Gleimia sp. 6138-11-ORH1 TaxID=2973937 RepID=UPI0021680064|nr:ATP-dependent DNA helicase UvrD2 [Gleimia sp. 6138-11-ORH1]MCS4483901.1 ATP-dependent DNA helicase UvrD2 [Gleimia sp. 6138-11-ORH1]
MPSGAHLLEALDPEQRAVATQVTGPLAVLAGAGTGKTRAITYRLAYGIAQGAFSQNSVLAVTFTARAAGEMRHRLRALGVPAIQARTFHAAALRQLGYFWPQAIGGDVPQIVKHKASLLTAACAHLGLGVDKQLIRDLAAEVEWAKVSMLDSADYLRVVGEQNRLIPGDLDASTVADLLRVYESLKTEAGKIDFEDVLLLMVGIMQENEPIARQIRSQYRHFVVDEFQDVSPLQYELLNQWLGGRHDICVVGDVAQTIYSFTGASHKYLVNFEKDHPGARRIELNRNYRSTPQIVSFANQVLATSANGRLGTEMPVGSVKLVSQKETGPAVAFNVFEHDEAEATAVASIVKNLQTQGTKLEDVAVLFRTNAQSEAFENAFAAAGIPFLVRGGERFFARPEIKQALLEIRRAAAVASRIEAGETGELVETVQNLVTPLGWSKDMPKTGGAVRERWEGLDALVNLAYQKQQLSLIEFNSELMERVEAQLAPEIAGVTLSSLHAAKGLEWENVILAGASEGLLPISLAETPAEIEEEKRLLYVGVTRAKQRLFITYAKARGEGRAQKRRVSRFLSATWPREDLTVSGVGKPKTGAISQRAKKQALLDELNPLETELFNALKTWRKNEAEERSVPPFVIFGDATLVEIAKSQPRNLTHLRIVRGVGAVKLEEFGTAVLRIVKKTVADAQNL